MFIFIKKNLSVSFIKKLIRFHFQNCSASHSWNSRCIYWLFGMQHSFSANRVVHCRDSYHCSLRWSYGQHCRHCTKFGWYVLFAFFAKEKKYKPKFKLKTFIFFLFRLSVSFCTDNSYDSKFSVAIRSWPAFTRQRE